MFKMFHIDEGRIIVHPPYLDDIDEIMTRLETAWGRHLEFDESVHMLAFIEAMVNARRRELKTGGVV